MSQYYQLFVNKLDAHVHDKQSRLTPYFEYAERQTKIRRVYMAQAILAFVSLYLMIGRAAQFVCNLIGFVYPAYRSLVALESSNKEDDVKWLTYWVVFSAFSVAEFFSSILVNWCPMYWFVKVIFLLWCSADLPNNGSKMIYSRLLRPVFLKHVNKTPVAVKAGSPNKNKDN